MANLLGFKKGSGRPVYVLWRGTPSSKDLLSAPECSAPECNFDVVSAAAICFGGMMMVYTCREHSGALDRIDVWQNKKRKRKAR